MIRSLALLLIVAGAVSAQAADTPRLNIVLIVLDDQNAFAGRTDLAPEPVTPELDRLAGRGVKFANAQCPAPVCNPSRTAFLSGLRPSTTGIYDNNQDKLPANHILSRTVSLPGYFRQHGYLTAGGGKVFSSAYSSAIGKRQWEIADDSAGSEGHGPTPPKEQLPLNGVGKHDWGAFPERREAMEDWQLAGWAAEFLAKEHDRPFFLACGIVKPHTPWYVPREYFARYPAEQITIAPLAADETAGLPAIVKEKLPKGEAQLSKRRNEVVAAYLAACRYADDCVGRILRGLDAGPHRANTLVVVCGDNGYQFGEKHNWSKGRLWEGSTQVPLVIAGPRVAASAVSTRPVNLLDLYPTLVEWAGLPPAPHCEGTSLAPLLHDPAASWDRPSLTTAGYKNHALRSERWRYILYEDDSEELYDHERDPLERKNLAGDESLADVKTGLRKWLPPHDEPRTKPIPRAGKRSADD